jgi:LemA protein
MFWIALIVVVAVAAVAGMVNQLISRKKQVAMTFEALDPLLRRRCELIPGLVAIVEKELPREAETLQRLRGWSSEMLEKEISRSDVVKRSGQIGGALADLTMRLGKESDLQGREDIKQRLDSLNAVNRELAFSGRAYNAVVKDYNKSVDLPPSSVVAWIMRYRRFPLFDIPDLAQDESQGARS